MSAPGARQEVTFPEATPAAEGAEWSDESWGAKRIA
jgi:hypothetical protein